MEEIDVLQGIAPLVSKPAEPQRSYTFRGDADDFECAKHYLRYLNPDRYYKYWLDIGMALNAKFKADGLELWIDWSRGSNEFDEDECRSKWPTFKPDGKIQFGTLVKLAQDAGAPKYQVSTRWTGGPSGPPVANATVNDAPADAWPDFDDAADMLANPIERPAEIIEGMCFAGSKISMSSDSKGRKTWYLIMLAICMSAGSPWLGRKTLKGKVLYINLELRKYSFQRRMCDIAEKLGITIDNQQLKVWTLRGRCVTIERLERELYKRLQHGEFSLIIFDPLYKLLGARAENDASQMADLFARLEAIAESVGAAYIACHHYAKGNSSGKKAIDRASGSGVIGRDGDCIITLTEHNEPDCVTMETIVRDFPPVDDAVLHFNYPVFEIDGNKDPADLKQVKPRRPGITADDAFSLLTDKPQPRETWKLAVAGRFKVGVNAANAAITECLIRPEVKIESLKRHNAKPQTLYFK
jgi:hypothetical protein